MAACAHCSARLSAAATWCGQCYAPVPADGSTPVGAAIGGAPDGRFGAPVGAVEPTPTVSRFGGPATPASPGDQGTFARSAGTNGFAVAPGRAGVSSQAKVRARIDGRLLGGRAVALTALAILLGAAFQGVTWFYLRDNSVEPATAVRYVIVGTFAFYCVVGALVMVPLAGHVRLRWNQGRAGASVAIGAAVGAGLAGVLVLVLSAVAGRTTTDEGARLLLSEGSVGYILAVVLIVCVAAPLVEEVLFRGLLFESLRSTGLSLAFLISSAGFAAWHLNLSQWWYYSLMGGLLGLLYAKRGLACSIAAHAGFNGVLVAVAVGLVLSPGVVVSSNGMSIPAPQGWTQEDDVPVEMFDAVLTGPSGATVVVVHEPAESAMGALAMLERTRAGGDLPMPGGGAVNGADAAVVRLPVGDAVGIEFEVSGHRGEMLFIPRRTVVYQVLFMDGGSAKANRDFRTMMNGLELPE